MHFNLRLWQLFWINLIQIVILFLKLQNLFYQKVKIITAYIEFILSVDIEGSFSGFTYDDYLFDIFVRIETGEDNYYEILIYYLITNAIISSNNTSKNSASDT